MKLLTNGTSLFSKVTRPGWIASLIMVWISSSFAQVEEPPFQYTSRYYGPGFLADTQSAQCQAELERLEFKFAELKFFVLEADCELSENQKHLVAKIQYQHEFEKRIQNLKFNRGPLKECQGFIDSYQAQLERAGIAVIASYCRGDDKRSRARIDYFDNLKLDLTEVDLGVVSESIEGCQDFYAKLQKTLEKTAHKIVWKKCEAVLVGRELDKRYRALITVAEPLGIKLHLLNAQHLSKENPRCADLNEGLARDHAEWTAPAKPKLLMSYCQLGLDYNRERLLVSGALQSGLKQFFGSYRQDLPQCQASLDKIEARLTGAKKEIFQKFCDWREVEVQRKIIRQYRPVFYYLQ